MIYFNVKYNPININDVASIKTSKIIGIKLSGKTIEVYNSNKTSMTSFYCSYKEANKEYKKLLNIMSKNEKKKEKKKYTLQKMMIKKQYVNDNIEIIDFSDLTNFDEDNEEEEENVQ